MILPDLVLRSRANQHWQYSGMDSLEQCLDLQHFLNYQHKVEYHYNSRGFRDCEWPNDLEELQMATWCIGDSFTVGLGQPLAHIWPVVLSQKQNRRTINVSMDGASNDWIYRRALDIIHCVDPAHIVVMWSYTHRREAKDPNLCDEQRRIKTSNCSAKDDYAHWINLSDQLYMTNKRITQITIPDFHCKPPMAQDLWNEIKGDDWPDCPKTVLDLENLPRLILDEIKNLHKCYDELGQRLENTVISNLLADITHIPQRLDWARDHHHFDILTAQWVVDKIMVNMGQRSKR